MNRYPIPDFEYASPESEGVRSSAISDMLEAIQRENKNIHSMLIWRHGKLIHENYFAPYQADTPHAMFSCSKTFTSMLIGIAQDKGLLSIHDPVLKYFEDVPIENPNDYLREMTLRDLLMMSSGHGEDTFGYMYGCKDGDWARVFLNRPVDHKPGTHFVYNTGATYMLSAILTRVTGKTALELAEEWLFGPMDIKGATWETCPKGVSMGGTGLHIRPRDMMKMGILLLSGGRWSDKQLISRQYIREAQTKKIDNRNPDDPNQNPNWAAGYCYQLWRCAFDAFRADGAGGQYIVVMPKYDIVVVFTSALGADIGCPLRYIQTYLLPGILPVPQVEYAEERARLAALAQEASCPAAVSMPDAAKSFPFGKTWILPENPMRIRTLAVREDELVIHTVDGEILRAQYGWHSPVLGNTLYKVPHKWMGSDPVSLMARWEEGALYLRLNYFTDPVTCHMTLIPQADGQMDIDILTTMVGAFHAICASEA